MGRGLRTPPKVRCGSPATQRQPPPWARSFILGRLLTQDVELISPSRCHGDRIAGGRRQAHLEPGLNFCQGAVAEMLDDPAREIFADARPRAADRRPRPLGCRLRLLLRLHPGADRRARATESGGRIIRIGPAGHLFGAVPNSSTAAEALRRAKSWSKVTTRLHLARPASYWMTPPAKSGQHPQPANPLSERLLRMAERERDNGLRLQAHHSVWTTWCWAGMPAPSWAGISTLVSGPNEARYLNRLSSPPRRRGSRATIRTLRPPDSRLRGNDG
jgi:hypothetical protein